MLRPERRSGLLGACIALPWLLLGAGDLRGLSAKDLVIRSWRTEAGLPQNTVSAIAQTRDGYLWLGTRDGLARFDGVRFTTVGLQEGLQSEEVLTLYEDRGGTLWIGTYGGGLGRLRHGRVETMVASNRRAGSDITTALAEDSAGRLWVGTRAGLWFLENDRLAEDAAFADLSRTPIRALLRSREGGMWVATSSQGLVEVRDGRRIPCPGPTRNPHVVAHCLLEDREGRLWVSVGNGMVLCREAGEWRVYDETDGLPFAYVTSLIEDADGTIWAGSLDSGLFHLSGGRFRVVRSADGLSAEDIRSLNLDREGNLWVGTRTGGLNRLSRRHLVCVGAAQGLTNDFTRSVAESPDGMLWVATIGGGLYRGTLDELQPYRPDPVGGFYAHVDSVLSTKDGSVWWGGANALLRWKGGQLADCHTNETWIQAASVTAMQEDPAGGLWMGTSESRLVHYQAGRFTEFPHPVTRGAVTALAVQPDGAVWVGSVAGGLKRIREGNDSVLTVTNGLRSHSIRTLHLDAEGALWVGTAGGGLSWWHDGQVTSFTAAQGLGARTVSQIVEDDFGSLWLGTSRGILKVRKADLRECALGRRTFVHTRSYGINDGMPAEECSGGFCPAGLKTRTGRLCFSTVKGLVFLNPQEQFVEAPAPDVLLEETLVNGRIQTVEPARSLAGVEGMDHVPPRRLVVPPGDRDIELHYTGLQFRAAEKVRFRYRMEGVDAAWVEAGGWRTAHYQRLLPGDYVFRVKACNAEGEWDEREAVLAISVLPFFWETRWFRTGATLAALGALAGALWMGLRKRYQRRLARLQMQHAVEKERLRVSQDMHDHIGGMLTQVSQLSDMGESESAGEEAARSRFERIGQQARLAVQALDEIVWATNPRNDNLASFVEYVSRFTDEYFECTTIRCWQEIPTQLPAVPLRAEARHNVFLAVKEACHNALKHARATEVWLRLACDAAEIALEVEDNGRGFTPGDLPPGGNGLDNMHARLASEGGRTELVSAPGQGTKVRFVFPRQT